MSEEKEGTGDKIRGDKVGRDYIGITGDHISGDKAVIHRHQAKIEGNMVIPRSQVKDQSQNATGLPDHVNLPPDESMTINLVPAHQLERLEEYRSDEGIALLLIGAFGGAVLGILSNWATDETFTMTRMSIVLMGLFGTLAILCSLWVWNLRRKSNALRDSIFRKISRTNPPDTQEH